MEKSLFKYKFFLFLVKENGIEFNTYQKQLLKAYCENRNLIIPRQFGRRF